MRFKIETAPTTVATEQQLNAIWQGMCTLKKLKLFDLSASHFLLHSLSYPHTIHFPPEIDTLILINIHLEQFSTANINLLCTKLSAIKNLRSLDLSANNLGKHHYFPHFISMLVDAFPDLESLYLSRNSLASLSATGVYPLFEKISQFDKLETLEIDDNNLFVFSHIRNEAQRALLSVDEIQCLRIGGNSALNAINFSTTLGTLQTLKNLRSLEFCGDKHYFQDDQIIALRKSLDNHLELKTLHIDGFTQPQIILFLQHQFTITEMTVDNVIYEYVKDLKHYPDITALDLDINKLLKRNGKFCKTLLRGQAYIDNPQADGNINDLLTELTKMAGYLVATNNQGEFYKKVINVIATIQFKMSLTQPIETLEPFDSNSNPPTAPLPQTEGTQNSPKSS